jgi:leader peptidase (prepilin peptidase) / N-methyltransferase
MGVNAIFNAHTWSAVPFGLWAVCFFVLGCIVGSFLNVCIHRMPLGLSIITPPSHCPHCKYSIPWYLNIPLLTWLTLHGRCKNCGAPISARYFIVELITGLAFLGSWLRFGSPAHPLPTILLALVYAIFIAGLIVATFIDFEHLIIPDEITFGGIATGLILSFLLPQLQDAPSRGTSLFHSIIGAFVGAGIVYGIVRLGKLLFGRQRLKLSGQTKIIFSEIALHLPDREIPYDEVFYRKSDAIVLQAQTVELIDRGFKDVTVRLSPSALQIGDEKMDPNAVPFMECVSAEVVLPREAMGLGDVKFMGAIGTFIGWQGVIFSIMVSVWIGAAVGIILILSRRREWSSRMPYGPYLALATIIWLFLGKKFFPHFPQLFQ